MRCPLTTEITLPELPHYRLQQDARVRRIQRVSQLCWTDTAIYTLYTQGSLARITRPSQRVAPFAIMQLIQVLGSNVLQVEPKLESSHR